METFSVLLALCTWNSPVTGEFPTQRPVTKSFDVYFDLRLNKRLSKQSWGWWFETLSRPWWRHCNDPVCNQIFNKWNFSFRDQLQRKQQYRQDNSSPFAVKYISNRISSQNWKKRLISDGGSIIIFVKVVVSAFRVTKFPNGKKKTALLYPIWNRLFLCHQQFRHGYVINYDKTNKCNHLFVFTKMNYDSKGATICYVVIVSKTQRNSPKSSLTHRVKLMSMN